MRVPGDFIGLRSVLLRTADHSAVTMTDAVIAEVPAQRMLTTFHLVPRLGAAILWAASRDEAMVVEHLVGIGRRDALTRTAHFLVELGLRLSLIGLGSDKGYTCPLNQYVLAQLPQGAVEVDGGEPQCVGEHVLVQRASVAVVGAHSDQA